MAKKKEVKKTTKKETPKKNNIKTKVEDKKVEVKKELKKEETKKDRGLMFAIIGIALVVVLAVTCFLIPESNGTNKSEEDKAYAILTIKDYGDVVLELDRNEAPITVDNFLELANSGFYDGVSFHRIIKGFMMQGGDPEGTGLGGAEKTIKGEFEYNGVKNNISHVRGTISMARSDDPDSASSQFFIIHQDYTSLDGYYAGFGHVVSGMEVIDKVVEDFGTEDDQILPEGKRPIISSIREIQITQDVVE